MTTQQAGFTPEPWESQSIDWDGPERGEAFIIASNGGGLVGAALPWPSEVDEDALYEFPRVAANSRLIAAAPELLEALQDAVRWLDGMYSDNEGFALDAMPNNCLPRSAMRAAIAKAVGHD